MHLNADAVVRFQRRHLLLGYVLFGAVYPAIIGRVLGCGCVLRAA